MPGEDHSNRLVTDALYDPAPPSLLGQQPQGPPRAPIRRRPTHHRDDRGLLNAVEFGRRLRARVLPQRMLQPAFYVPLADPRDLPRVPAHGRCGRANSLASVEEQQHLDPSPDSRRQRRPPSSHPLQLRAVFRRELQPSESRPGLHPML